jgi:uncharacterized membrane protein
MIDRRSHRRDRLMAQALALLLVTGVAFSAALLGAGLVLLALTGHTGYGAALTPALLTPPETVAYPRTIPAVVRGALAARPFAVIALGVLVLIATPVLRVAASVLLFLLERDYLYTAITMVVLIVLLSSIFLIG